jgi:cytochrome bd ubiquinol oxidase subunit II
MNTIAFALLAFLIVGYVVLDGYDLGVGVITPFVARTPAERAASMQAIGPYWNANEVWLIAGGGLLFALFPRGYAAAFSGFYLPLIVLLWLLMIRGIAIELRNHIPSSIWRDFWDFCFAISSGLLIVVFGVALGNVIRGVPLDGSGYFSGTFTFLLNPFSDAVALLALLVLTLHGALFLAWRTDGPPAERARALAMPLGVAVGVVLLGVTAAVAAQAPAHFPIIAWLGVPALAIVLLAVAVAAVRRGHAALSFASSSALVVVFLVTAARTMYPYLLPGYPVRATGLSLQDAATSPAGLVVGVAVASVGMVVMLCYAAIVVRAINTDMKGGASEEIQKTSKAWS